ncbi:MAG: nucleotidyltransferase domain-containing protein [Parcubacteria group bacterium]
MIMGKYEAKIPEIKERIVKEIDPEKIILFGSYAWGNPTEDSDVDLFVVKKSSEKRLERQRKLRKILFDSISGNFPAMDILVYTPEETEKSVNEHKNLFIEDILRHGKTIYTKPKSAFNVKLPARPLTILHES